MRGVTMLPTLGLCMPSSCSVQDIGNLTLNAMIALNLPLFGVPLRCDIDKNITLDTADIAVITILIVLLVLSLSAGFVDMWIRAQKRKKQFTESFGFRCFMAFSFYTNTQKLLSTKSSSDDLRCLHGMRFLSTAWVVMGHTWEMALLILYWNMMDIKKIHESWMNMLFLNSSFSVDTFFVMGGLLVTYGLMKLLDKNKGRFNIFKFYIHRYLRITPTYALWIGLVATIYRFSGSGPFWFNAERESNNCRKNWWTNLLYVNNVVNINGGEMCHAQAWYLANDMQFYILSPLLVYPLWRWKKFGIFLVGITTIGSILSPALLVYFNEGTAPTALFTRPSDMGKAGEFYMAPYTRIQTYLVGMTLGYILHRLRGKKLHMSRLTQTLCWGVATGTCLTLMFGIHDWFNPETKIPRVEGMIYAGLHRFSWGVGMSWIIFACVKGYGGLINTFLSWKVFIPLGRLTFCIYLMSFYLQNAFHFRIKQVITYDPYIQINFFVAHVGLSICLAFLCSLTMESPFIILENLLLIRRSDEKKELSDQKKNIPAEA